MTKLSATALEKSQLIIQAIIDHPFNKKIANGSLNSEKFAYYIEQDTLAHCKPIFSMIRKERTFVCAENDASALLYIISRIFLSRH